MNKQLSLLKTNAYLALFGGIATLVFRIIKYILFFLIAASSDENPDPNYLLPAASIYGLIFFALMVLTTIIRIATFVYSIIWIAKYGKDERTTKAAPILIFVAFGISFFFYFGLVADILTIIGGALYMSSIKHYQFDQAIVGYYQEAAFSNPQTMSYPETNPYTPNQNPYQTQAANPNPMTPPPAPQTFESSPENLVSDNPFEANQTGSQSKENN